MNQSNLQNFNTIFFSRMNISGLYVNENGQPIWPVCNDAEEALLKKICMYNGITLLQSSNAKNAVLAPQVEEWVAVLEPEVVEDATLYAHLTGRKFMHISDLAQLESLNPLSIFVFTPKILGFELLTRLANLGTKKYAPGMICTVKPNMRPLILTKTALSRAIPKRNTHHLEIYWDLAINSMISSDGRVFLGKLADEKEIRKFLTIRPGILLFKGESDGVDAYLTENALICDIRRKKQYENQKGLTRCLKRSHCYRINAPISEAIKSNKIFSPDDLVAQIVVWAPCWGAFPPPYINSQFGVGFRLSEVLTTGAVISTMGGTIRDSSSLQALLQDLRSGLSVGEAVASYNWSLRALKLDQKLYIFGDPNCRVGALPHKISTLFNNVLDPDVPMEIPDIGFLKNLIEITAASSEANTIADQEIVTKNIEQYQLELRKTVLNRVSDETLFRLQNSVLNYLANSEPALIVSWMKNADLSNANDILDTRCYVCGNTIGTTAYIAYFNLPWLPPRVAIRCPQCGFSSDKSLTMDIEINYSTNNEFILQGDLTGKRCSACVITMQGEIERTIESWPRDQQNSLITRYVPEGLKHVNTYEFFVILMCDTQIVWFHGYPFVWNTDKSLQKKLIDKEENYPLTEVSNN